MGSLLVASAFVNAMSHEAEGKGAAQSASSTATASLQPVGSMQRQTSSSKQQSAASTSAAAMVDPPAPDSIREAGSAISPSNTGTPMRQSRQFTVPALNLSRLSNNGHAGDGHGDAGPLTSSWGHGPLTSNFSKSASQHLGPETARRSSRMAFLQSPSDVRTDADLHHLDEGILYSCKACATLTKGARLALAKVATHVAFEEGSTLCHAGQDMDRVLFIIHGQAESREATGAVITYEEGDSIGSFQEPASLDPHTPRTRQALSPSAPPRESWPSTVVAIGPVECAVVTQQQWADVRSSETYWDARQVRSFLEDLPTFGTLTSQQLHQLSRLMRTVHYPCDSVIFHQGQDSDDMFLLRSGFVRLLKCLPMDTPARTKLNKMSVECSHVSNQLQVLTTPRGTKQMRAVLLSEAPPKTPGPVDDATQRPATSDSDASPADQGSPFTKLPQLKQKTFPTGASPGAHPRTLSSSGIPGPAGAVLGLEGASMGMDGPRPRLSSMGGMGGVMTPPRRDSVAGMQQVGPAGPHHAPAHGLSRHAVHSPMGRHPASPDGQHRTEDLLKQKAFSSRSPFLIDRSSQVYVEMSSICSGALFGECTTGRRVQRAYSAVADTRTEVFQLVHSEIKARMGESMMFLWASDRDKDKGVSDDAVRAQLEKNMEWELYKRKLMQEVFTKKQAKRPASLYR